MLELSGNAAAVMMVAKGGLRGAGETHLERLQTAIGAMAGVQDAHWVRDGDVLRIVAKLHDTLIEKRLLRRPTESIVEAMTLPAQGTMSRGSSTDAAHIALLNSMMTNIALMRVIKPNGDKLVSWLDELPEGFEQRAIELAKKRRAAELEKVAA